MKKMSLIGAMLLVGTIGASAQADLVKEAEQGFKSAKDYPSYRKVIDTMTPAFTNEVTKSDAKTYFLPGKAGFKVYDNYIIARSLGQEVNPVEMGNALLDGYGYFLKAFEYDSLPDAKGKIKPKYSKDMINEIVGHVNDFDQVAVGFWQAHDFDGAYNAWEALLDIPSNPRYKKSNIKAYPDSTVANIRFNQGLAAWQAQKLDKALQAFDRSIALGHSNPQLYEYAYSVAYQAGDSANMQRYAEEGLKKFGTEDPRFLQWTVNGYILHKEYDKAAKMLQDAIAADPNNAAYHLSLGVLAESQNNIDEAIKEYTLATKLNDKDAQAFLNLGRALAEKYDALDQATGSNMSQADYNKYAAETLNPILKQSAEAFETSYKINEEMTDALRYLKNIYYRLNDNTNLERVNKLLMQ